MNTSRKNGGYTLVEFVITIAVASLVTLAATTLLYLGVRINRQSIDTASAQTTARILLSAMEKIATEGRITGVEAHMDSWKIIGEEGTLFAYHGKNIYTGDAPVEGADVKPFMEDVEASFVELNGKLLTISLKTADGGYTTSVYCRTLPEEYEDEHDPSDEAVEDVFDHVEETPRDDRTAFLQVLASQYTDYTAYGFANYGFILQKNDEGEYVSSEKHYSEWYIGGYGDQNPGWNAQTPWCACFISWGLERVVEEQVEEERVVEVTDRMPREANVDNFMDYLKTNDNGHKWINSAYYDPDAQDPRPGDLIFFDWTINGIRNPEHIGAVVTVEDGCVYTIEGNSGGRVAVRKYGINDPRIIGYGLINWDLISKK